MKIEDMVMVINNQKGIEKNFLCSFESFVKQYVTNACDNFWEVAEVISELNHASEKDTLHQTKLCMRGSVEALMN